MSEPVIQLEKENAQLWNQFDVHTNEMIVTKLGRRMFPTLRFRISGLDVNASYAIFLDMDSASDYRYKFQNGQWVVAGRADPPCSAVRTYAHPDSPAPGKLWMQKALSFHRVKLTNNALDTSGHIHLNSMHKYQPRVSIYRLHECYAGMPTLVASVSHPSTAFIAVTAYQNDHIIQLKIQHNPFAKGFRENGGAERKRRLRSSPETDDSMKRCNLETSSSSDAETKTMSPSSSLVAATAASPDEDEQRRKVSPPIKVAPMWPTNVIYPTLPSPAASIQPPWSTIASNPFILLAQLHAAAAFYRMPPFQ